MTAQTAGIMTANRQEIINIVSTLPDDGINKLKPFIAFVCHEIEDSAAELDKNNFAGRRKRFSDAAELLAYIEGGNGHEKAPGHEEMRSEISALEAYYGTVPNAETIAAMKEAEAGIGEPTTLEKILAECNARLGSHSELLRK